MTACAPVRAFAPAKINLALHVTGQRADGYHFLDSLVVLVDVGDNLTVKPSSETTLRISGPSAGGIPTDGSNLVLRAAALMSCDAEITLEKHLPAEAGIGGGSSDAAACLRALSRMSNQPLPGRNALLALGADVPVCMVNGLSRMQGTGGLVSRLGAAPDWPMILVNPRVSVPTPVIFRELASKTNAPLSGGFPVGADPADQMRWLCAQRNDLEPAAIAREPVIAEVLEILRAQQGCQLARMSGSGATCFALMQSSEDRDSATAYLRQAFPDWWVVPANPCSDSLFS
ncbi:4-(cytidine 5'-diphospho)-2-C-methyl-D-erythritol kinase [uncultured Roseobacter sp.]|uniref:4-(cytidine 5'-diphospho)-2-C-methyl-D-erythritol kinase n=1 Tax=uncultured Roseobacter sp. TaxID=114847 RepID=UPI00261EF601|nr:4-(cytidine 5'-diphospho)-2-C-methyl-D-erythritol kinase [uncultured Roseobacter sp.]